jgi:hypothetical protein
MDEYVQKKLYLWILIIIVFAGLLFAVWAFFLNRGTLVIHGKAPFSVNVIGSKTISCIKDDCEIVLAPGQYNLLVEKSGYKSEKLQVNIPVLKTAEQTVNFFFLPVFSEVGKERETKIFINPLVPESLKKETGEIPLFFENENVTYIKRNSENGRQTLYYASIEEDSRTIIAASFIRDLKDYSVYPAIEEFKKIGVADRNGQATFYLVDLEKNSREAIVTMPLIINAKFLSPDSILIDGRNEGDVEQGIYLLTLSSKQLNKIAPKTSLDNVEILNEMNLIAATNQNYTVSNTGAEEGQLITLGNVGDKLIFIEYSIISDQSRLLKVIQHPGCKKLKMSSSKKSVYCLGQDEDPSVYELTLKE